jgi:hypothetical protein
MPRLSAYALVLVSLLACAAVVALLIGDPEQPGGSVPTNLSEGRKATVAEFRSNARSAYMVVANPCDFSPDLKRKSVLAPELGALADFERSGAPANLKSHLQVARDDAAYVMTLRPRRCDPEGLSPVETRIEMDRSELRETLARMRAMAPALASEQGVDSSPTGRQDAEFRHLAREVTWLLSARCPISRKKDRFSTLAESRELAAHLRNRIRSTRFEDQVAVVEADVLFDQSTTIPECMDPDVPTAPERIRHAAARVKVAVTRMEEIAAADTRS